MNLLATCRTFLFLEGPLLAMRALRTMPLRMLINALPRELFLTIGARSAGLEPGLRIALSTVFTLSWMMAVM